MTKLALSAIFAGMISCAAMNTAYAQTSSNDPTTVEAKQRFSEGIKFADQGDHEQARLKFGQAWALLKSPAILYNLARSEQLSNHPVEALEHWRMFLKMGSDPKVTPEQKQRASENQQELTKKVGQIEVDAPSGAKVTIDGKSVDWTANADPFPVLPGKHVVEATVDGKTRTANIDCAAGLVTKATLNEAPAPTPVTPPPPPVSPPPKEPEPGFWTTGRAIGAGAAVVGVVGVTLGVVFQLQATSAGNDASTDRAKLPVPKTGEKGPCVNPTDPTVIANCRDLSSKTSSQSSDQNLRTTFFIAGGALLVGGVVLFLVSAPKSSEQGNVHFLPYASADGAGLNVFGRF